MDTVPSSDPVTDDGIASGLILPPDLVILGLVREACAHCDALLGALTIVLNGEARVVARVGVDPGPDAALDGLFARTVREPDALVVDDLVRDPRFCDEPYVVGPPNVRFVAGVPLFDGTGLPVGSLCVADPHPRALDSRALHALQRLARAASGTLNARRRL